MTLFTSFTGFPVSVLQKKNSTIIIEGLWAKLLRKEVFYNIFGWFVFYFQKLTYAIMLGHMQKINQF